MRLWHCFVILPLKACSFLSRVKYRKESRKHSSSVMKMSGSNQDKHMQYINETKFYIIDKCLNKQKKLQLKIQNELDALNDLAWEQ